MKDSMNFEEKKPVFLKFLRDNNILENYRYKLGSGTDGVIYEVKLKTKNRFLAAKLVSNDNYQKQERMDIINELKGPNIVSIDRILTTEIKGEKYLLIIMEKAILRDLGKLTESYFSNNVMKLIYNPYDEQLGNNLLRFYCKQIIDGMEILNRNFYVHFDLKPENILISLNLNIKISDFSLITKVDKSKEMKIPGGTPGYVSREYFDRLKLPAEDLKKQDYFALGSTIFSLKYGQKMLQYEKFDDLIMNNDRITDLLHKKFEYIKSRPFLDEEFLEFLCSLIQYRPCDRPIFEEIFRNKWLNKNLDIINDVLNINEGDEEKIIIELQKSDFLNEKEKSENKLPNKFKFKKKRN